MYNHVEGNIYTIPVPLPNNPLRCLNSYVIKDDKRSLVIDTGFRMPECLEAMTTGLNELGIDMNNADIFLTHLHSDHSGLAPDLASSSSHIFISRTDGEMLLDGLTNSWDRTAEFRTYGFSAEELSCWSDNPSQKYRQEKLATFTYIADGDILEYGGHRLQAISTPGHTPGHLCLYDRDNKIMFLGDHVLFNITPNITCWPNFPDPLGHYVHSLMDISIYDIRLPLPAHRQVTSTVAERVGTIIEHHGARIRELLDVLDVNPGSSTYELAGKMTWRVHGKTNSWADFPLTQKWFAVGEAAAHLEYLLARNRVRRELDGTIWRYYSV